MGLKILRKAGEGFYMADDLIHIQIERIEPGRVIIGVEAPRDINILRDEVRRAIKAEELRKQLHSGEMKHEDALDALNDLCRRDRVHQQELVRLLNGG